MKKRALFKDYYRIARDRKKLSLHRERKLIARARNGCSSSESELVLHLIGYFLFRINTTLYRPVIEEHGEDILQECVLLTRQKIESYRPDYRGRDGDLHPVHLSTYMWKSLTGMMFAYVKAQRGGAKSPRSEDSLEP